MNLYKEFVEDYSPTDEAKNWAKLFAIQTYFHFLDDYGIEKKSLPRNYYDYTKEILPLTTEKLICWEILAYRIQIYNAKIVKPKMMHSLSNQMDSIDAAKEKIDSLYIDFLYTNSSDVLLNQLSIADYYLTKFEANIIDGYLINQELIKRKLNKSFISNPLQEYYKNIYDFLNKPNDRTDVLLKKMDATPINETFNQILKENEGKVVYIDCWATWCGPCKKAMPYSKRLMKKFDKTEVSFVYVCIESEEKVWKKIIAELNLQDGQHYLMDKEQSEFFRDIMQVEGIPCYFLIDKKGQMVEQGSHLHPEDKLTEEKIASLLNTK